jgi:phenylpropionate dioxygenase-like ring-hydroxylating dioxygenase large terminal subunit
MIASDKADPFRWEHIMDGSTVRWNMRNVYRNFKNARKRDMIICYRGGSVHNALVGVAEVEEEFFEESIIVRGVRAFAKEIPYDDYKNTQVYQSTQAGRMRNRGTLFSVTDEFVQWLIHRLLADGDEESAAILQLGKGSCRSV